MHHNPSCSCKIACKDNLYGVEAQNTHTETVAKLSILESKGFAPDTREKPDETFPLSTETDEIIDNYDKHK